MVLISDAVILTRCRFVYALVVILCLSYPGLAVSGAGKWSNIGTFPSTVSATVVNPAMPSVLYAGTNGSGVFKSVDSGLTWSQVNNGLINTQVRALVIDPATPSILYAGTTTGVYKSVDSGLNWSRAINAVVNERVLSLAIDPLAPSTLYAGTEARLGGIEGGVFKSTNSGMNWTTVYFGGFLSSTSVDAIAIDPANPSILYISSSSQRILKSSNGGNTWAQMNAGLPSVFVHALAVDPVVPSTIYAGVTTDVFVAESMFKSTDSGANWLATSTGISNIDVTTLAIDPATPSILYAGTATGGVFKSADGGRNWSASNTGLTANHVTAFAIDPVSPTTLYAGGFNGNVFKFQPVVALSLNGTSFNSTTNKTMTLTATTTATNPPTNADVYVALQLPDGTLLVMQPGGSFSTALTPLLANIPIPAFTGPIFNFTFSGAEPVGTYTWFAALTQPGTLNLFGTLTAVPFSFAP